MSPKFLLLLVCLFLTGCPTFGRKTTKPETKPGQEQPVNDANRRADAETQNVDTKNQELAEAKKEIGGKTLANIQAARKENTLQPPSKHTDIVEGELGVAESRLAGNSPDPVELLAIAERKALVESGKVTEARLAYDKAQTDAKTLADKLLSKEAELATAITNRDIAIAARDKAMADFTAQLAQNKLENDRQLQDILLKHRKEVDDLKTGIAAKTQFWLSLGCYGLGVALMLIAGIRAYLAVQTGGLGVKGAAKSTVFLGLMAMICFGLGKLVSQWWFWWACGAVIVAVLSWFIWLMVSEERAKRLAKVADDVIGGVEDIRKAFKQPSAKLVQSIQNASTPAEAEAAAKNMLREVVDPTLSEWVTEGDGTAQLVDERRRATGLVSK